MTGSPTLEVPDATSASDDPGVVPPPLPPDDPEAWYAPAVVDQRAVHPGIVVTTAETWNGFDYRVREPHLSAADREASETLADYFADANVPLPRTRQGAVERMRDGFSAKHHLAVDRLTDLAPAARRRVTYWTLRDTFCLGRLTPHALDDRIEVATLEEDDLVVHTENYAPASTDRAPERDLVRRLASERVASYEVPFRSFDVPVIECKNRVSVRSDHFAVN